MRSAPAAAMITLASATGQARTLPASRTGAGGMMPCSMQFLMLLVLRGFAVRLRPRHAATSPGWEECPEQADLRVVALGGDYSRSHWQAVAGGLLACGTG
jgi:hypothetical protein